MTQLDGKKTDQSRNHFAVLAAFDSRERLAGKREGSFFQPTNRADAVPRARRSASGRMKYDITAAALKVCPDVACVALLYMYWCGRARREAGVK